MHSFSDIYQIIHTETFLIKI